ncbi:leucyl aminopeptidase [Legionella worsleiensis]|uniref:Probable cytosol aminopeptidase n=1 Tax=Legionella worsleiensis TaxID=45076 RepID=A0A0W1AGD7_9GAMM|nr:leucyl aminopeptidase [Legionella worsleiensis]KTD80211.1 aminopeptidase A/I [Legionella worsleiensis]STY31727.1 aminopeptidase A/I [Legionella worsleiensis]
MNYGLTQKPALNASECLVLGIFSDAELPDYAIKLDKEHDGIITRLSQKATEPGGAVWQSDLAGHSLLVIQFGKKNEFKASVLQKRIAELSDELIKKRITSALLCLPQLSNHSAEWQLEQMVVQIDNIRYQLLDFKKNNPKFHKLESIRFYLPGASEKALELGKAVIAGVEMTRHLANMPANICTPTYLGEQALELAKHYDSINCKVMGPDEMRSMGMGLLLAVSQGSSEPPRLIDIQYKGAGDAAPIILVGKGITFDSGGLSIKPANAMDEMKYDMSGAASVLGTIKACALLKLPVNVIGLIASAENMVSGAAVKSGDIVTSMSGQTVEIINTDAEGRLVMADALTYAERYNPEFVLDIATLTGAMIVALGSVATGFMTEDDKLAKLLEQAALESQDKVWRMPLDEAYQDALDSPLADMINAGFDRTAGSITAACFLSRFTKKYRWAHLDIAGTAWISGKKRNATGRPVPLLTQLIRHVANSH